MSLLRPLSATIPRAFAATPATRSSNPIIAAADRTASHHLSTTRRSAHSATQVKRLFKNNPGRLRVQRKKGILKAPNTQVPEPIYPPVFKPSFLSNGWSAPPPPEVDVPKYPFKVTRTKNKPFGAVGFLPVYRDVR